MSKPRIIVVGGGAAGFFAAITCAEAAPDAEVTLLERSPVFLAKVRISGGGRCNVTHADFDPRAFATRYPRGEKELIGPFQRFSARDTVEWFAARGVRLKAESDGRMFPTTDSSRTIIECLLRGATSAGVRLMPGCGVERVSRRADGFELGLSRSHEPASSRSASDPGIVAPVFCHRLLLATGGCRAASAGQLAVALGHTLVAPVPSLFAFQVAAPWLRALAGVTVADVEVSAPDAGLSARGPLLVTHLGLSGPAALRLSAWGAREFHAADYRFPLLVNWLPGWSEGEISRAIQSFRETRAAKFVVNAPLKPLPARLWEALVLSAGIDRDTRWSALARSLQRQLERRLARTGLVVSGKSLNKDEFVTCGGVRLAEVNFKTMESRVCPGLHIAGELLDIDGLTGGFNLQAAWTTGWIAGCAMPCQSARTGSTTVPIPSSPDGHHRGGRP
jgi:predicted Rossmann fold flavoprotein